MVLYRLAKQRHADDISGKGSEITGGRWNQKGIPALYLAENRSLTVLETIVHNHYIKDLYNRYVISVGVPENMIEEYDKRKLPKDWNARKWTNFTIVEGTKWLLSFNNLILKLPSAVFPDENIFLVNPRHPEFSRVKIIEKKEFMPDSRLVLS